MLKNDFLNNTIEKLNNFRNRLANKTHELPHIHEKRYFVSRLS